MKTMSRVGVLAVVAALLVALPVLAEEAKAAAAPAAIDIATCQTCHEQQVTMLQRTYHGKLANSCSNCHGNKGAEHVEKGDPSVMISLKKAPAAQVNETCFKCHNKLRQANFSGGMHDRRGLACTNCHSIHNFQSAKAQLKTQRDSETCFQCHQNIRALMMRTSHHPVREGKIGCANCHDPHDSRTTKYVSAPSVNDKCYSCHMEKRGPFLWDHAPVRENCLNCHNPHGSNHAKLLVSKPPYLCQRCHANTRHPGTLYDARAMVAAGTTANNRAVNRSCPNCHANIHGSNAPSGPYLGR